MDHFGRLDLLINNAGVIEPIARIEASDPELLRTEFGKKIHGLVTGGDAMGAYALWGAILFGTDWTALRF